MTQIRAAAEEGSIAGGSRIAGEDSRSSP
jgi:hypothetical protein